MVLELRLRDGSTSPRCGPDGCGRLRSASRASSRAISRRSPSNEERTTAWGVSSMMKSTPVRCSSARMLRPSRPMIRPFMSSEASSTTLTVVSAVWLAATRWSASATRVRARRLESVRASSSSWRTGRASSWRIMSSIARVAACVPPAERQARRARARAASPRSPPSRSSWSCFVCVSRSVTPAPDARARRFSRRAPLALMDTLLDLPPSARRLSWVSPSISARSWTACSGPRSGPRDALSPPRGRRPRESTASDPRRAATLDVLDRPAASTTGRRRLPVPSLLPPAVSMDAPFGDCPAGMAQFPRPDTACTAAPRSTGRA